MDSRGHAHIGILYCLSIKLLSIKHLAQCLVHNVYYQLVLSLPLPFFPPFCHSCFYWTDCVKLIIPAPTRKKSNAIWAIVAAYSFFILCASYLNHKYNNNIWKGALNVNTSFPRPENYILPIITLPVTSQQKLFKAKENF